MADVVVEHSLNDAERLARDLVQTLEKRAPRSRDAWRLASAPRTRVSRVEDARRHNQAGGVSQAD